MKVQDLWRALHACPELAGHERQTQATLLEFLRTETGTEVVTREGWCYAVHHEPGAARTVVARADMDAVPGPGGIPFHGCGHDGHMAMLAGAAQALRGRKLGKQVIFLFQPAEETGAGAQLCTRLFQERHVDYILGCHNLPGYALGTVYLTEGTFACASRGVTLRFTGKQTHAAYPELGKNPAPAVARVLAALPELLRPERYGGMTLGTVVGVLVGSRNFGVAASNGEICLTLRAEREADLLALQDALLTVSRQAADANELRFQHELVDVFPATVNRAADAMRYRNALRAAGVPVEMLPAPMRWSEDFGWYLQQVPGLFFGLGSGKQQPGLHTPTYCFPTVLLEKGVAVWLQMLALA